MVPTVLLGANVIGPSGPKGNAMHQIMVVVAVTGGGKQWVIEVINDCVKEAGRDARFLLGPNRFKSGGAIIRFVKEHRVSLFVQDEFGCVLKRLGEANVGPYEKEISERLRELWTQGPGSIYNSPAGATDEPPHAIRRNADRPRFPAGPAAALC